MGMGMQEAGQLDYHQYQMALSGWNLIHQTDDGQPEPMSEARFNELLEMEGMNSVAIH